MNYALIISFLALPLAVHSQYTAEPRWGQATLLLDNTLLVHGGKVDTSGGQTYTSAADTTEVLYLDLSAGFEASSVPWQLVNGASNASAVQAPSIAWHTISALNSSHALVFGGVPDANGQPPLVGQPDSVAILDAFSRINPTFTMQPSQWAGQPARRIHHSAVSTPDGRVWIIGGEKPDQSTFGYSESYVFDVAGPSFTQLSAGLPDLTGHCSVILPNGYIVVLGGYSPSTNSLLDFSGVYVMDTTQSSPSWSRIATAGTAPGGRRAFACTLFDKQSIFVHGGSDASRQTVYSDGWRLDLSQSTWTWSSIPSLSELGARTDHFAVAYGNEIIFGFGYGTSAPASSSLQVFQPSGGSDSSGSWTPIFSPPSTSPNPSATNTVPAPTGTRSSVTHTGTSTSPGIPPTKTPASGTAPPSDDPGSSKPTTAIAVGTVLGFCAAAALVIIVAYRVHQRRKFRQQFMTVGDGDDGIPPSNLPAAGPPGEKGAYSRRRGLLVDDPTQPGLARDIIAAIGVPALAGAVSRAVHTSHNNMPPERRDMLADEDTRDFALGPWYARNQRSGTAGSAWSLRSMLPARMRREGSTTSSVPTSPWREKSDPFSDGAALLRDAESGYVGAMAVGASSRPTFSRRQSSYTSTLYSYTDPFADPYADAQPITMANVPRLVRGSSQDSYEEPSSLPYRRAIPGLETIQTIPTVPFQMDPHTLSPLTEVSSRGTLILPSGASSSSNSHVREGSSDRAANMSPFDSLDNSSHGHESGLTAASRVTSLTSMDPSSPLPSGAQSPMLVGGVAAIGPRQSSIIDPNPPQGAQMRRSDTWWARFSKRRGAEPKSPSTSHMFEFRDPHPPPARLGAIAEAQSQASGSPEESPGSTGHPSRRGSEKRVGHGKSVSSLRTLDSDAIAHMGGMDVAQRINTGSIRTHQSSGSYDSHAKRGSTYSTTDQSWLESTEGEEPVEIVSSPIEVTSAENPFGSGSTSTFAHNIPLPASTPSTPQSEDNSAASSSVSLASGERKARRPTGSGIAARVSAYEKRLSTDVTPPPTNTRGLEERRNSKRTTYGLVPRPTLYLANPDRKGGSGDS
ncbi:hypothetical protein DL96DRAFT_835239 [Flagelloscypha sp. PMI_526]|nr:hypothetical protein DL96DRAFT_835239 [Flagelloscypha sp. PMI_526]